MAKIVVFASGDDAETAKTALSDAGLDAQIVAATAANLLHIVIGMVGDVDDGEANADDEVPDEETPAEDASADEPPDEEPEIAEESLSMAIINGEQIKAVKSNKDTSVLYVVELQTGAKTTYGLNESKFSFWPSNIENPVQRVSIEVDKHFASVEVPLMLAKDEPYIYVGKDLIDMFK